MHLCTCDCAMEDAWLGSALATIKGTGAVGREKRRLQEAAFRTPRSAGGAILEEAPVSQQLREVGSIDALDWHFRQ